MPSISSQEQSASPLYLLAVLVSARRSGDRVLERTTREKLKSLGVHIRLSGNREAAQEVSHAK